MDRSWWCKGAWGRFWGAENVLFLDLGPNDMNVFTSPSDLQIAQAVKNPPLMREIWVQSLGWDDPLEEGITTHSSILAWRIPWTEEPGGLQSMGSQRVGHDWVTRHITVHVAKIPQVECLWFVYFSTWIQTSIKSLPRGLPWQSSG